MLDISLHSVIVLIKTQTQDIPDICIYITITEFLQIDSSIRSFDGSGDVKVFIENDSIHSSLKGYGGEKATQNIAGRLEGRAFDVYMRLGASEKKDPSKIKDELLKEFERGNQDREVAIN